MLKQNRTLRTLLVCLLMVTATIFFTACASSTDEQEGSDAGANDTAEAAYSEVGIDDILVIPSDPSGYKLESETQIAEDSSKIGDRTWESDTAAIALNMYYDTPQKHEEAEAENSANPSYEKKELGDITYYIETGLSDELKDGVTDVYCNVNDYNFFIELIDTDDGKLTENEKENFYGWLSSIEAK